jgi:hypothetical protein
MLDVFYKVNSIFSKGSVFNFVLIRMASSGAKIKENGFIKQVKKIFYRQLRWARVPK